MARPLKRRRICELPRTMEFAPDAATSSEPVFMTVDEYEVIRLIDYLGYSQEECSLRMNVARTTVQLIYDSARRKVAVALVCARRLKIDGGIYELCPNASSCCQKDCPRGKKERGCCEKEPMACKERCNFQQFPK